MTTWDKIKWFAKGSLVTWLVILAYQTYISIIIRIENLEELIMVIYRAMNSLGA